MALQVWLPLTKDLRNQGLNNMTVTNHNATLNTAGKLGSCYYFNGNQQWLQLSDNLGNFYNDDWSVACWLKPTDSTRSVIISEYNTSGASNVGLELTTSRIVRLYWNGSPDINFTTAGALPLNEWTHLTVTKAGRVVKVYFNGELKQTYTNSSDFSTRTSAAQPRIGDDYRGNSANTVSYQGYINDFRMYDHCLSPMEVKELSKGLVLHYPLNRQGWGQENLAVDTATASSINGKVYSLASAIPSGTKVTISCWIDADNVTMSGNKRIGLSSGISRSDGAGTQWFETWASYSNGLLSDNGSFHGRVSNTQTILGNMTQIGTYIQTLSSGTVSISQLKVELGDGPTPWCPNSSDALATTMGLNGTTEYDCSGFCNNGTKNNISYISDTPKYAVSSVFNGSNSYIKVNDNNWMVKGMTEMTVNLWAKATTWPTNGGRLISCTESGGFNLEAGNSGYWRFPIYVYTNSGQTSSAYKYDSNEIKVADLIPNEWNMITLVYNNTGTKTYLNGELHHTYTNTSYGINFNTNARLFLGCEANTASPYAPYFNGKESDFRIYATALSASDVKSLYQNCATIDPDGTIRGKIR